MGWFSKKKAPEYETPCEQWAKLVARGVRPGDASAQTNYYPCLGGQTNPAEITAWGVAATCTPHRGENMTGYSGREWENAADERAESLGRAQAERYSAEHQYQRPAEPERYNNQTERDVEMWQPPTREEFNRFANEAWQAIQAAPPSNTPDSIYWSPMETAQPDITSGIPQRHLEARNNDGSTDLPAHFSGTMGNYAPASLRHEREQAGGQYVTIRGQQVWIED